MATRETVTDQSQGVQPARLYWENNANHFSVTSGDNARCPLWIISDPKSRMKGVRFPLRPYMPSGRLSMCALCHSEIQPLLLSLL